MSSTIETSGTDGREPNKIYPTLVSEDELHEKYDAIAHYTREGSESPVERVKFEGLDDNDSICSDESEEEKLPLIPDGGWEWVVVIAAFLVLICVDSLAIAYTLLETKLDNDVHTQSLTEIIGRSIYIGTPLLAGPMSVLVKKYDCRIMTIFAGILSIFGSLLAALGKSTMMCLIFGLLSSIVLGTLYVTAVVSVAFWFDKKRNFAVSLVSSGIIVGKILYELLEGYLLAGFDRPSRLLLLAGTMVTICVFGALMSDPEWLVIRHKRKQQLSIVGSMRSKNIDPISSKPVGGKTRFPSTEEVKSLLISGTSPEYIVAILADDILAAAERTPMTADQNYMNMHSTINRPTSMRKNEQVPMEVIEKLMKNQKLYNIIVQHYPEILRDYSNVSLNVDNPSNEAVNALAKLPVELKAKKPKKVSKS